MHKLISVIIPTFNRKNLTDKAIASVITKYPALVDIIVVDDCGTNPYKHNALNLSGVMVNVIKLEKNVGAGMARQAGVDRAFTKYIAFLDSDDCYDSEWLDYAINLLQTENPIQLKFISGITMGEKRIGKLVRKILATLPNSTQLISSRIIATIFNPFYTPSLVIDKDLCTFKNGLRHCEDYYSNVFALFKTERIYLPNKTACHLGRIPNSHGGTSSEKTKMHKGEMQTRISLLSATDIPLPYKLLVPIGMIYQLLRSIIKTIFNLKPIKFCLI